MNQNVPVSCGRPWGNRKEVQLNDAPLRNYIFTSNTDYAFNRLSNSDKDNFVDFSSYVGSVHKEVAFVR